MNGKKSILITKSDRKENCILAMQLTNSRITLPYINAVKCIGDGDKDSYVALYDAPEDFDVASLMAIMKLLGKEKTLKALNEVFPNCVTDKSDVLK